MDDGDGGAFLAGTTCTTRTVGVVLDIVGQSEVDDVCQVVDVETARCHIGGYE